jgi:hypothetical protein
MKRFCMSFACLALITASPFLAGCESNTTRAIKMQKQSGKMNRNNDYSYYAICTTMTQGGHTNTWKGPLWSAKERAMQDAFDHNKANAGHHAEVKVN